MDRIKNLVVVFGLIPAALGFWSSVVAGVIFWDKLEQLVELTFEPDQGGLSGKDKFEILWEDYLLRREN